MQILRCCAAQLDAILTLSMSTSRCLVRECLPKRNPGRCAYNKERLPVGAHVMTQVMTQVMAAGQNQRGSAWHKGSQKFLCMQPS